MVSVQLDRFLRSETDRCGLFPSRACVTHFDWLLCRRRRRNRGRARGRTEGTWPEAGFSQGHVQHLSECRIRLVHYWTSFSIYQSICHDFILPGFLLTVDGLAKKFGLTPEQFGENLRDSYQRHETEQFPAEPVELAKDYVCSQFSTPEAVLEGTRYMVAMQIAREPLVRHVLRQTFQERAKINIKPTKKGKKVEARRKNLPVFWERCLRLNLSPFLLASCRKWTKLILPTPSST